MTKRPTKKPMKGRAKKAAARPRHSPGAAVERATSAPGAQLEVNVATLVRDIGAMIDAARKQVSVTANAEADLQALGLRVEAGDHRDRGGHGLRSWFITHMPGARGAPRSPPRGHAHREGRRGQRLVVSGYTRAQWPSPCTKVGKLRISVLDGAVLELATGFATLKLTD